VKNPKDKTNHKISPVKSQVKSGKSQSLSTNKLQIAGSNFTIKTIAAIVLIVIISIIAYYPSFDNNFLNWDDDVYVTDNLDIQNLNIENLRKYFTQYYVSNYHPLTMLSIAIDYSIAQANPQQYLVTNLIIHIINSVLVFFFILKLIELLEQQKVLTGKKSWRFEFAFISSALFAVHTLHVESVVWISERKDVLYAMFFFASLLAYLHYIKSNKFFYLALAFLLFLFSLLSKAMAASLAVSLFAIDFVAKRNLLSRKVILEKIPFFTLAFIFGIVAIFAQRSSGALGEEAIYAFHQRIAFASFGFVQYLIKLTIPISLSAYYPYPPEGPIPFYYWLSVLIPLSVGALLVYLIKREHRFTSFCILFFIINIALVLQLIPVGNAVMADRYSYIPSVGFFMLIALLAKIIGGKIQKAIPITVLLGYIVLLSYLTFSRVDVWQSSLSLWDDVIAQYKHIPTAWNNRGNIKKDLGKYQEAIEDYNECLKLKPDHYKALNNRGIAKKNIELYNEAIADYNHSISLKPDYEDAYTNRANVYRKLGDFQGALNDYDKSLSLKPNSPKTLSNRAAVLIDMKRLDSAITDLSSALQMTPNFVEAHFNLANAYLKKGDFANSLREYNKTIELRPQYAEAYSNRANLWLQMKDTAKAYTDYETSLKINPQYVEGYLGKAGVKLTQQNYNGAIEICNSGLQAIPNNPRIIFIRGVAFYSSGQLDKACQDMTLAAQMKLPQAIEFVYRFCGNRK